ncbi:MAG: ammonia channel protein, partial [Vicinamibacteria bacterium]
MRALAAALGATLAAPASAQRADAPDPCTLRPSRVLAPAIQPKLLPAPGTTVARPQRPTLGL